MRRRNAVKTIVVLSSAVIVVFFVSLTGSAREKEKLSYPAGETTLFADFVGFTNPDGVVLIGGGWRRWIKSMDEKLGIPSSYLQTGMGFAVNPAFGQVNVHGEWQPAIFAQLHWQYDFYNFFGVYGALLSFPSAEAKFGKNELKNLQGHEETGFGSRFMFQPTLYAKIGPVIIRNQTDWAYYLFNGVGPYFLEWEYNTLLKDGDFILANRTQFLAEVWKGAGEASLLVVPFYEITHAEEADLTRHRTGVQLFWVPLNSFRSFARPRIYSQIGLNLKDPNRQQQIFFAIGIGADFDL